jgi:hypothetical protein
VCEDVAGVLPRRAKPQASFDVYRMWRIACGERASVHLRRTKLDQLFTCAPHVTLPPRCGTKVECVWPRPKSANVANQKIQPPRFIQPKNSRLVSSDSVEMRIPRKARLVKRLTDASPPGKVVVLEDHNVSQ